MSAGPFDELLAHAQHRMAELTIPGMAIGVWHDGALLTGGLGTTSAEYGLPVNEHTLFQIGSISKTFLGTAVMLLVQQGKLELDVPVVRYVPELRLSDAHVAEQVTMRHLLTHTGGWTGDFFQDTGWGDDALAKYVALMGTLPQELPFGTLFSYNNAGFNLAARVIEKVCQSTFEEAMSELLFAPLGLKETFYYPDDAMTRSFAVGHIVDGNVPSIARPWSIGRSSHGAGGIAASISDLLRYAAFHSAGGANANGEQLLSEAHSLAMRQGQAPTGGMPDQIGLTWFLRQSGEQQIIGHAGATNGQMALLTIVPGASFAIASLTNSSTGATLNNELARLALRLFLGIEESDPEPVQSSVEELEQYIGTYTNPLYDYELRMADTTLELIMTSKGGFPNIDSPKRPVPPPMMVALYAPDKLVVTSGSAKGTRGDFGRNAAGEILWLRIGSRVRLRLR
jgi:CubicO group peptidase (beta-lactamase class C family)